MPASTSVPVEAYLHTSYDPDMAALLSSREAQGKFHVYIEQIEQHIRVSPRARYRIPDVCAMALPYASEPVFTQPPQPPHLVIEILSPDDRPGDVLQKVAEYLDFGELFQKLDEPNE